MTEPTRQPLNQCPNCGCRDLFVRKDFPQKLGLSIVLIAGLTFLVLAASRSSFYLGAVVLLVAVIIDATIYRMVGRVTVCYRCRSEFRGVPINPRHEAFELAIAEKYRQP